MFRRSGRDWNYLTIQGLEGSDLRRYASAQTAHLDDEALLADVRRYYAQAEGFGVRNENAVGLWCHMQATSRTDLGGDEQVRRFMVDPACGADADERMEALFELRTKLLRRVYG